MNSPSISENCSGTGRPSRVGRSSAGARPRRPRGRRGRRAAGSRRSSSPPRRPTCAEEALGQAVDLPVQRLVARVGPGLDARADDVDRERADDLRAVRVVPHGVVGSRAEVAQRRVGFGPRRGRRPAPARRGAVGPGRLVGARPLRELLPRPRRGAARRPARSSRRGGPPRSSAHPRRKIVGRVMQAMGAPARLGRRGELGLHAVPQLEHLRGRLELGDSCRCARSASRRVAMALPSGR